MLANEATLAGFYWCWTGTRWTVVEIRDDSLVFNDGYVEGLRDSMREVLGPLKPPPDP
jgi:hypothetical protein